MHPQSFRNEKAIMKMAKIDSYYVLGGLADLFYLHIIQLYRSRTAKYLYRHF